MENALIEEFYRINQLMLPKCIKKFFIKIENLFNILTTPFFSIKQKDVVGVFDEQGNIHGGFLGFKCMKRYQVYGLFLDEKIKRTKHSPVVLKSILEKIKTLAENKKMKIVSCEAYKQARSTIRLYKKAGFKEIKYRDIYSPTITLHADIAELGKNIEFCKKIKK